MHRSPSTSGTDTPPPPILLFLAWTQTPASSFRPPSSPQPSRAPAHRTWRCSWKRIGRIWAMALSGGMVSSCHWGCGAVAARALQGEEEKGEGGGWAQQESLRGRRKLAGRRKSSGRGRRLQGPGQPQWRNRAQRRLRKRLSPAEGSRQQNSAPVTSPPSALCTPPRRAAVPRCAGIRGAVRPGPRWRLRHCNK